MLYFPSQVYPELFVLNLLDLGMKLYDFNIRDQQEFANPQPINVRFEFSPPIPAHRLLIEFSCVLTSKVLSSISDGQRTFGLIQS